MSQHRQHYLPNAALNARRTDWGGLAQAVAICIAIAALFLIPLLNK